MTMSMIIPHYNSPILLREMLITILNECEDSEIIVVDDNSTSGIEDYERLVEEFAGKVVFLVNNSGVKGAGAARNVGLRYASGEWLMFADADDWFVEGWYSHIKPYFETDNDIVYFKPMSWDVEMDREGYRVKSFLQVIEAGLRKEKNSDLAIKYSLPIVWSKLIRRKVIEENDIWFDEVMYTNDVMFSVKSSFYSEKDAIDEAVIYCVARRQGTLTRDITHEALRTRFDVACRKYIFLREHITDREYRYIVKNDKLYDRFVEADKSKEGRKNIEVYRKMFEDAGIPIWPSRFVYFRNEIKKKYQKDKDFVCRNTKIFFDGLFHLKRTINKLFPMAFPHMNFAHYYERIAKAAKKNGKKTSLFETVLKLNLEEYYKDETVKKCLDYCSAKEYVKAKGYVEYLANDYGVYKRSHLIKWGILPDTFVIRGNYGDDFKLIVDHKTSVDREEMYNKADKWIKLGNWEGSIGVQYRGFLRKLIVEEHLLINSRRCSVYCFKNEPCYVRLSSNENVGNNEIYDIKLNRILTDNLGEDSGEKGCLNIPAFEKIKEITRNLCEPFPYVRIDFVMAEDAFYFDGFSFAPEQVLIDVENL